MLDLTRDSLLPVFSRATLKDRYLLPSEASPQEGFMRAARAFADDEAHAQRLYSYASQLWFMFSTPILANGGTQRGLPISCNLQYVEDSRAGLFEHYAEAGTLSTMGAGLGGYWGHIRSDGVATSKGSASSGSIPFMKVMDAVVTGFKQGKTRRASYAAYQDISHPEILEFLDLRNPTGGDINRRCLNLHHAVNIPDAFMEALTNPVSDAWELKDPHSGQVTQVVSARTLWQKLIETRAKTGEPYLHFTDTSNRALPQAQKDKGLRIHQSNLCVAGDTLVWTEKGNKTVRSLVGIPTEVWNGVEWSEVVFRQTGSNQPLLKVSFEKLPPIRCTPEHKFYVGEEGVETKASELQAGDVLQHWQDPRFWVTRTETITSVTPVRGLHDTFCATEPRRHRIMFNGVVTGNCNEIYLPTSAERTAVCCLSSVNLEKFDEWRDNPLFISDIIRMLDNVISYYIEHAPASLAKAVFSAKQERSLGLGAMGFHAYLQSKQIPFESALAVSANLRMFKHISSKAQEASEVLHKERGGCLDDPSRRNMHLMAIAPNASSGIICGNTSPSVEPYRANAYTHKTDSGTFEVRNKFLEKLLAEKYPEFDTQETWSSITLNGGSVQQLSFLTDYEKDVFKTAPEIDQRWVVEHAGKRQPFICQGQSINLFVPEDVSVKELHTLHFEAWQKGLKGLYYLRTDVKKRTNTKVSGESTCLSCEG